MRVLRRRLPEHRHDATAWQSGTFISLDLETTGLNLRADQIVSVGLVQIVAGTIDPEMTYYSLMRPACPVSTASIQVHGITTRTLATAPEPSTVAARLREQIGDAPVVAHAAWVEKAFLRNLARITSEPLAEPMIDTAALCRAAGLHHGRDDREPCLEVLAQQLDLPVFAPHHALGDAFTTAVVFLALAARLQATHGALTVRDLRTISREFSR